MTNGKGDAPRPCNGEKFRQNFDEINWHHDTLEVQFWNAVASHFGDRVIEYEIPPCRAIYSVCCDGAIDAGTALSEFGRQFPKAVIRKTLILT